MTDKWPKHADGRNKKIGEMDAVERRSVIRDSATKLEAEFARPEVQERLALILQGRKPN